MLMSDATRAYTTSAATPVLNIMIDVLRLHVVQDFLDLFSKTAPMIHALLFRSDEGRFHPLLTMDLRVCRSLPAKECQALLMHTDVDNCKHRFHGAQEPESFVSTAG